MIFFFLINEFCFENLVNEENEFSLQKTKNNLGQNELLSHIFMK